MNGNLTKAEQAMKYMVKVVIPVYREEIKDCERDSLRNTVKKFAAYPIVFIKPWGMQPGAWAEECPQAEWIEVTDDWLGTKRGIQGYNAMMMSAAFYELFPDTEYILICHLDAWIFDGQLTDWCRKGYDIVAAPWPTRPLYNHFPFKQYLRWKQQKAKAQGHIVRSMMYGRIGNGGLCLRRVEAFKNACTRYAQEAVHFLSEAETDEVYNEDIFWALIPKEFHYPPVDEALRFAFDLKPALCYRLNHHRLPMGCHGYMHRSRHVSIN